jgi:hypothetical protein
LAWDNTSIKKTKDKQILITRLKIRIKEIKDKLENKMNEQEQYTLLMTMEDKLLTFNKYGEVTLAVEDFDTLKSLYNVYFNKFNTLNTTCSACVKEILNICISRYSALKKQFDKVIEPIKQTEFTNPIEPEPEVVKIDYKSDAEINKAIFEIENSINTATELNAKMNVEAEVKEAVKKKGRGK